MGASVTGDAVTTFVGLRVGTSTARGLLVVVATVGAGAGVATGDAVSTVSTFVGLLVGVATGDAVSTFVGLLVGVATGCVAGAGVTELVGLLVGTPCACALPANVTHITVITTTMIITRRTIVAIAVAYSSSHFPATLEPPFALPRPPASFRTSLPPPLPPSTRRKPSTADTPAGTGSRIDAQLGTGALLPRALQAGCGAPKRHRRTARGGRVATASSGAADVVDVTHGREIPSCVWSRM